jgi:hypothetical protein
VTGAFEIHKIANQLTMPIKINISGDKLAVPKRIRRALYHGAAIAKQQAAGKV